jgi:hypothetical protein
MGESARIRAAYCPSDTSARPYLDCHLASLLSIGDCATARVNSKGMSTICIHEQANPEIADQTTGKCTAADCDVLVIRPQDLADEIVGRDLQKDPGNGVYSLADAFR